MNPELQLPESRLIPSYQTASTLSDSFLWIKPVLSLGTYEEDLLSDSLKVL